MVGIKEYIAQIGKNFLYSETLFQASKVKAGTSTVAANWNERGAVCFILHTINISVPSKPGVTATIKDQFGRTILFFNMDPNVSGQYLVEDIIEASKLLLVCSDSAVRFSVGYQFMSVKDSKE